LKITDYVSEDLEENLLLAGKMKWSVLMILGGSGECFQNLCQAL